ncbi:MAG: 4-alpha-glucanotransferase [Desulfomonilaceae bacterium]
MDNITVIKLLNEDPALMNTYEAVQLLAKVFGVELQFTDNWGHTFQTPPSIVKDILEKKGVRIDSKSLSMSPQVVTLNKSATERAIPLYLDASASFREGLLKNGVITVIDTQSKIKPLSFSADDPEISVHMDSKTGLTCIFAPISDDLPPGDYKFVVKVAAQGAEILTELRVIMAPATAYCPGPIENGQRLAGLSVSLYSVRSENNWGVGDFTDLLQIIDWAFDDLGVHFVGLNPLHALFNSRPYNCSPYMPSSRLFYNYIYIDVVEAAGYISKSLSDVISGDNQIAGEASKLRAEEYVDYEGVATLKNKTLRMIFRDFYDHRHNSVYKTRWRDFEDYLELRGEDLNRFATFCVLRDNLLSNAPNLHDWTRWPNGFRHPESPEVAQFKTKHTVEILFHSFLQWIAERQLSKAQNHAVERGMLVGLYHDVAMAVDPSGADSWSRPEYFISGFSVGAPPDAFAPDGQDWGFQPPNSDEIRRSGYINFRKGLAANSRFGGALRIDHVMQIHHLFWIPKGQQARNGVYVKDYEQDLLNVICLESHLNKNIIVGEDLGTLPFNFRERLIDRGIFSYRIFYFERDSNLNQIPSSDYPAHALVSLSNHDLPTFAGFWQGLDIKERIDIGRIRVEEEQAIRSERSDHKAKIIECFVRDGNLAAEVAHRAWVSETLTDELHTAALNFIFQSPSRLAIVSMEDLLADNRQQNLPGTITERPNWVTKAKFTLEELKSHPEAIRMAAKFKKLILDSERYYEIKH